MNWSKTSKMNLLKGIKFGLITRISFDQDTFEDYADLIGARFNADMEEFFNLLYPNLYHKICNDLTHYLMCYPRSGYRFPRLEFYPLRQQWKAQVKIFNMEIHLQPALIISRFERDIAYSQDYMVQVDYVFNERREDWERVFEELPDNLLDPIPF